MKDDQVTQPEESEHRQRIRRRLAQLAEENREWRRAEQVLMRVADRHADALRAGLWQVWSRKPRPAYRVRPWVWKLLRWIRAPFFEPNV